MFTLSFVRYSLFCKSERESVSHLPLSEQSKELGLRWRNLDEEVKNTWKSKSKIEKEKKGKSNTDVDDVPIEAPQIKKQKTQETVSLPTVKQVPKEKVENKKTEEKKDSESKVDTQKNSTKSENKKSKPKKRSK